MDPYVKIKGGLLGCLPADLFRLIQSFLSHKDYRNLMNSNNTTFSNIKYETVKYRINPAKDQFSKRKDYMDLKVDDNFYYSLINERVKDKSRQIYINIRNFSSIQILHYAPSFQGIKELRLWNIECLDGTFDFNLFNNIHTVSVGNFIGIKSISSGFENVKLLSIAMFRELISITNINMTETLETFYILSCKNLNVLNFSLHNVVRLSIDQINSNYNLQTIAKSKLKEFSTECENPIQSVLLNPIDFSSLSKLYLTCQFPENFHDFSLFENISDLSLRSADPEESSTTSTFSLTRFNGEQLSLTNFKVFGLIQNMSQDHKSFSSMRKLCLTQCHDFTSVPSLPELKELSLTSCKEVKSVPSFITLRYLYINGCNKLNVISPDQPKLNECWITFTSIEDVSFATHCQQVYLSLNHEVKDVSMLRKVKSLNISECNGLTSVDGLSGDPLALQPDQRRLCLSNLLNTQELSLHHIRSLQLVGLPHLHSCTGIHDIKNLQIRECQNFVTTSGLKNITRVLDISDCFQFDSLVDVEGIPLIRLEANDRLKDFSAVQDNWTDCGHVEILVQLFALNSMQKEFKELEWRETIEILLK